MSDPNKITVYSPSGEPFEMSRANARDLTTHAGWSTTPPTAKSAAAAVSEEPQEEPETEVELETEEEDAGTNGTGSVEATETDEENADEEAGEDTDEEEESKVTRLLTKEEDFAGMDRAAVVAYLSVNFPDFKPHHLSKVEKLVSQAIELAENAAK